MESDEGEYAARQDLLLLSDYMLDSLVFYSVLKDLLNGSNLPFLKDYLSQTTESKDLLKNVDISLGLKNIISKKSKILGMLVEPTILS